MKLTNFIYKDILDHELIDNSILGGQDVNKKY